MISPESEWRDIDMEPLTFEGADIRSKVKRYREKLKKVKIYLDSHPTEWGRFQSEFNQELNSFFSYLMVFEKKCLLENESTKKNRLEEFFLRKLKKDFLCGEYINWSAKKPYGYAGDFKIIEDIYTNHPRTTGFERLFDNFFLMSPASVATRNRKEDFRRYIEKCTQRKSLKTTILNVASGPCREIYEFFHERSIGKSSFYCYENEAEAIVYAKNLLSKYKNVYFEKINAVRLALKQNIEKMIPNRFDLIYSTGLFDYLEDRVAIRLVSNLRRLLKSDGELIISNYRDKYSNPSLHFMELVGDWKLVYRTEEEFKRVFTESGFSYDNLNIEYEQQGIMQYCIAKL